MSGLPMGEEEREMEGEDDDDEALEEDFASSDGGWL